MEVSRMEGGSEVHILNISPKKGLMWWKKSLIESDIAVVGSGCVCLRFALHYTGSASSEVA